MKPNYCTQNEGDCTRCSLVSYRHDCANLPVYALADLAEAITGGNLVAMAKLANDAGTYPRIDENSTPPGETLVRRAVLVDMAAAHAGSRTGRKLAQLLAG